MAKYNKEWLRAQVDAAEKMATETKMPETAPAYKFVFTMLVDKVREYLEYMDKMDSHKGTTTSAKKAKSSAENGKKGGRPKGSRNKPKAEILEAAMNFTDSMTRTVRPEYKTPAAIAEKLK